MNEKRLLIVDDEEGIRDMIKAYLGPEGFTIHEAADGVAALERFRANDYDLIVLDVMMPEVDGWSVCREIRKTSSVPILMLSARGEEYDRLFGFELGVDDYVVKPFSPKELLARIKAIIRRNSPTDQDRAGGPRAVYGGLVVEFDSHNVYVDGQRVSLTPKEYELLQFFVKNPNKVFSRDKLLTEVWGYDFTGDDRTVDTHVKMLRESIKGYRQFIVTVWGTGYKFEGKR